MITIQNLKNKGTINFYETEKNEIEPEQSPKQLLQLIGEQQFGEDDFLSLRRTGFSVYQVDVTNLLILEQTIDRIRQTEFVKNWHLSSHAKNGELFLNGFYIKPDWLITRINFQEIEVFFLDACDTAYFADSLTGIAKYVISINDKVDSIAAAKMALDFWTSYYRTESVKQSFLFMKNKNPESAENLYLHY